LAFSIFCLVSSIVCWMQEREGKREREKKEENTRNILKARKRNLTCVSFPEASCTCMLCERWRKREERRRKRRHREREREREREKKEGMRVILPVREELDKARKGQFKKRKHEKREAAKSPVFIFCFLFFAPLSFFFFSSWLLMQS